MEKTGDFRLGESRSDLDFTKKAEYESKDKLTVVDKANKDKIQDPKKINGLHRRS